MTYHLLKLWCTLCFQSSRKLIIYLTFFVVLVYSMYVSIRVPHDMAVATRQMGDSEDGILQGLLVYFSKFNYDKAKEQAVS